MGWFRKKNKELITDEEFYFLIKNGENMFIHTLKGTSVEQLRNIIKEIKDERIHNRV